MSNWKQVLADLATSRAAALKRHAFLLCGNAEEAEDLVQDALLRAFSRPLRAPRLDEAEAYVRVIIANRYIDLARRRTPWRRAIERLSRAPHTVPDPADGVAARADLAAALGTLSPRQRACVVLYYYGDLSVGQIARALNCGEGTVKRTLHDARTALQDRMSPAKAEGGDKHGAEL